MYVISVAALFLELVLIRWIGTEVRIFAYVQNLMLVTCFLGFGVGCLKSGKPTTLITSLICICSLVFLVSLSSVSFTGGEGNNFMAEMSNLLTLSPDAALWGSSSIYTPATFWIFSALAVAVITLALGLIAVSMVPLGQWIGYGFDHSEKTIRTYTVNLVGSLVGTWLLLGLSWFRLSPVCWIALAFLLVLLSTPLSRKNWIMGVALLVVAALALYFAEGGPNSNIFWSPYQKLAVTVPNEDQDTYYVSVNNTGYMTMAPTAPEFLAKHPDYAAGIPDSVYDSPFRFVPPNPRVLIVGAGAGNDASAALRNGASHVDAIEIDPVIYALGKKLHPDHPYDSDKVTVIVNDARNFLHNSHDQYDAIIFGLLDSHTGYSGYSNLRVDNYVYTKDAFDHARRLLKPDGVLVLKFEVRAPWLWIGERFYRTLTEVFDHQPVIYSTDTNGSMFSGSVFLESNGSELWQKAEQSDLKTFLTAHPTVFTPDLATAPAPATDDWPYPYNKGHFIPHTYLTVSAILLAIALFMVRGSFAYRERKTWTPFFLGAGFLLMETQLISRLTLYFGTTWIVSGITISTVLCMLVLANVILELRQKPIDRRPCYAILILSLIANYFFPWEQLDMPPWAIGLCLSGAYAVAVLMAGLIFTSTFQKANDKSKTLGANVIGAVGGGLLQNISFIVGLKALLPTAALCYLGAALADTWDRNKH
jgi:spermidine synthase